MRLIVLASASPRRKELLQRAGVQFEIDASDYAEDLNLPLPPPELAMEISRGKARAVAHKYDDAIIIAADTIIVIGDAILGKPAAEEDARRMLRELSGRGHLVITGYTVLDTKNGKEISKSVETKVWFKNLADEDIRAYIRTGEPLGKAGAYAIQEKGASLIEKFEGDFDNVVGLPVGDLMETLKEFEA